MMKCTRCGVRAQVGEYICERCGAELPDPTEVALREQAQAAEQAASGASSTTTQVSEANRSALLGAVERLQVASTEIPPQQLTILAGAEIFLEDGIVHPGTVYLANGRIVAVAEGKADDPQNGATYIDLAGMLLNPGFIDLHIHGMMGLDTNQATAEDFQRISLEAAKRGMTSLTPTTVACSPGELSTVLTNLRAAKQAGLPGARLLGLHLESNFISPQFKGAQPADSLFTPNDERGWHVRQLLDEHADDVSIITVAPEIPGVLDFIPWLRERNIIASIGHSAATYEQALEAIDAGATHATHLFNAMAPLHHRNPGIIGACLERDEVFVEMVCDGVHVHPAIIAMVIAAKCADRFVPVSDALQGAGMVSGEFLLGGQHVSVHDGVAWLDNGTIAGSITTMDRIVGYLVEHVGWDLSEALYMVSTTPANALGLNDIGRIAPDARADLVVLDQALQVVMTFVDGKLVYQREG